MAITDKIVSKSDANRICWGVFEARGFFGQIVPTMLDRYHAPLGWLR
jgi:hypothetical protein